MESPRSWEVPRGPPARHARRDADRFPEVHPAGCQLVHLPGDAEPLGLNQMSQDRARVEQHIDRLFDVLENRRTQTGLRRLIRGARNRRAGWL